MPGGTESRRRKNLSLSRLRADTIVMTKEQLLALEFNASDPRHPGYDRLMAAIGVDYNERRAMEAMAEALDEEPERWDGLE